MKAAVVWCATALASMVLPAAATADKWAVSTSIYTCCRSGRCMPRHIRSGWRQLARTLLNLQPDLLHRTYV
jgi:hypothetical protein